MKTIHEIEKEFFDELAEVLEKQFPKKQCKERSNDLVLNAFANIIFRKKTKELLEGLKEQEHYLAGTNANCEDCKNEEKHKQIKKMNSKIDKIIKEL